MSTLVVASHPDDEVLGCGGTIARRASEGEDVYVVILGEGITSRYESADAADRSLVADLSAGARAAGRELGTSDTFFLGLPDNRFDTVALLDIVKGVERIIDQIGPTTVFTQHGGDLNIDHQITYRAVLAATRPLPGSSVRACYAFEVASSTEWAFQRFAPVFRPGLFVDISLTIDAKVKALARYGDELREFPHPRSSENLRAMAARWGATVGVAAAEAFEVVREVR